MSGKAEPKKLLVNVDEGASVTALLYESAARRRAGFTLILAHGAGGNQLSPFMRLFGAGLSLRGVDTLTFNFLYSERGRGAPDHKLKLESCYRAVIAAVQSNKKLKKNRLAIGGKSMGGRIASQVAALEPRIDLAGLVFLGYPLHPPGKPEQLRDKHLKDIIAPLLFIQGTRDPFGSPEELRAVIKTLTVPATLHLIEGGDHSFKVPKSTKLSPNEVYESIMDKTVSWLAER